MYLYILKSPFPPRVEDFAFPVTSKSLLHPPTPNLALERWIRKRLLGGTACLTLLVQYALVCILRHYLSSTANLSCCIIRHV